MHVDTWKHTQYKQHDTTVSIQICIQLHAAIGFHQCFRYTFVLACNYWVSRHFKITFKKISNLHLRNILSSPLTGQECSIYLASIHRCSYPGRPCRWRCWSRAQSGTLAVVSHSVCLWRLCESSHSCIWHNHTTGWLWSGNEIIHSISSVCVPGCKIEMAELL